MTLSSLLDRGGKDMNNKEMALMNEKKPIGRIHAVRRMALLIRS